MKINQSANEIVATQQHSHSPKFMWTLRSMHLTSSCFLQRLFMNHYRGLCSPVAVLSFIPFNPTDVLVRRAALKPCRGARPLTPWLSKQTATCLRAAVTAPFLCGRFAASGVCNIDKGCTVYLLNTFLVLHDAVFDLQWHLFHFISWGNCIFSWELCTEW